jgi:hypothetical protein
MVRPLRPEDRKEQQKGAECLGELLKNDLQGDRYQEYMLTALATDLKIPYAKIRLAIFGFIEVPIMMGKVEARGRGQKPVRIDRGTSKNLYALQQPALFDFTKNRRTVVLEGMLGPNWFAD